jgi:hypothetical protein
MDLHTGRREPRAMLAATSHARGIGDWIALPLPPLSCIALPHREVRTTTDRRARMPIPHEQLRLADTADQCLHDARRRSATLHALLHHTHNLGLGDASGHPPDPFGELRGAILARRAATDLAETCNGADLLDNERHDIVGELPCAIDWLAFARGEALRARPADPAAQMLAAELLTTIQQMQRALVACGAPPAPAMLCGADGRWLQ